MDQQTQAQDQQTPLSPKKKVTLGLSGIVVGFLALTAAFLSPWLASAIDPPPKPIEQTTTDLAARLAKAAKAKLMGEEAVQENAVATAPKPSRFLVPSIIGLGMIAAGFGIASLLKSESRMAGGGAIALGLGAVVVQWSIIVLAAVLILLLVYLFLPEFLTG